MQRTRTHKKLAYIFFCLMPTDLTIEYVNALFSLRYRALWHRTFHSTIENKNSWMCTPRRWCGVKIHRCRESQQQHCSIYARLGTKYTTLKHIFKRAEEKSSTQGKKEKVCVKRDVNTPIDVEVLYIEDQKHKFKNPCIVLGRLHNK